MIEESSLVGDNVNFGDCSCKVGRVADRYELSSLNVELVERWVGDEGGYSLRELEDYLNREVLRAALEDAGAEVLDGEVENYYRLLTDEETSAGARVQAERRLERQGVDPDQVTADFVSHQTIHTHLRNCLDVVYESDSDPETRLDNARDFVQALQSRTGTVTENTLENLRDADVLDLERFDVFTDVMVSCSSCGRVRPVGEVFEDGGCRCQDDDSD